MIIHLINGTKITLSEENHDNYIHVADFSRLDDIDIVQRIRSPHSRDEYTRLTISKKQLLFIDYENEKSSLNTGIPFCEIQFTPDRFTKQKELLPPWPKDVKEETANG